MRRRGIIVAIVVLLCVGGYATWWTYWSGDPRFVGRWLILDDSGSQSRKEIVFAANGTGERQGSNEVQSWTAYHFDWWVEDNFVVLREESPLSTFELRRRLNDLYWTLTGNARGGIEWRLQFEELGPDRMRVWQVDEEDQPLGHVFEIVRAEE